MALLKFKYRGQEVFCPMYDRVFKALFDDGKLVLLASFLSSILGMDIKAEELTVRNSEMPVTTQDGKLVRLDFRIMLIDGSVVNIEMQVDDEHDMGKRSLYSLAKLMPDRLKVSGEYKNIRPVIAINILDFNFIPDSNDYINRYRMKNLKTNAEMPNAEAQEIIFIELKKLPKTAGSMGEWWLKFLTVKSGKELDMIATQSPVLEMARERLVGISADEKLKYEMDMIEKANYDYNSRMARLERLEMEAIEKIAKSREEGMEKGRAEGRTEGRTEGRAEGITENAKKMKTKGFDNALIAEITGLSLKQIERL